ncbi:MAG: hypothetical protein C5B54_05270 [Acidobacteria bacterium]|nr:MAG: hypothetical protein C5B54_05270 [Acidobacteriota bacterium]
MGIGLFRRYGDDFHKTKWRQSNFIESRVSQSLSRRLRVSKIGGTRSPDRCGTGETRSDTQIARRFKLRARSEDVRGVDRNSMKVYMSLLLLLLLFCSACSGPRQIWQFKMDGRIYAPPVVDGENLFIVSEQKSIMCANYHTGKEVWRTIVDGPLLGAPTFSDKYLFVATQDGGVFALNKTNGTQVWKQHFQDRFSASLTKAKDMIFLPSLDGNFYALSQVDGHVIWRHPGGVKYIIPAIVQPPYVFVGGWEKKLNCFDMDGSLKWQYTAGYVIVQPPLIRNNIVFLTAHDNYVYALDLQSGRGLWRFAAGEPTNLLIINNELVFGDSARTLFVIQPESGKLLRKIHVQIPIDQIYSRSGKCLFVHVKCFEVDTQKGTIKKLLSTPGSILNMLILDDQIFVTDDADLVTSFTLPDK